MAWLATEALDAATQIDRAARGVVSAPAGVNAFADRLADLDMDDPHVVEVLHDAARRIGHAPDTVTELGVIVEGYAAAATRVGNGEGSGEPGLLGFCLALHGRLLEASPGETVSFMR